MAVRGPSSNGRQRMARRTRPAVVAALVAGLAVAFAPGASAAPTPVSQSAGRFLSGAVGTVSLDQLVALAGESAANNGGPAVTHQHTVTADVLGQQLVHLPGGIQLPSGGALNLGAANQFAQARPDGSAHAASGAVTTSGAIGTGGSGAPQTDGTVDMAGSSNPVAVLGGIKLGMGGLAATADQAAGRNGAQSGDYEIANLKLVLSSPALAQAIKQLRGSAGLTGLISTLGGTGLAVGPLQSVQSADPVNALLDALNSLNNVNFGDGAITGSLTAGALTIDVAKLLKAALNLDLNNLPPNTHLIAYIAQALPQALTKSIADLQKQLTAMFDTLTLSLDGTPLAPGAGQVKSALATLLKPLSSALGSGSSSLSSTVFVPMSEQLQKLLDVVANVQEHGGGAFTERALQLNLIGDPVARINLASASVGPGAGIAAQTSSSAQPTSKQPSGAAAAASQLANTGAGEWLTKLGLFGLLGLCLGGALFGATIGVRKTGRHTT
jgi:hypothetical protein